MLGFQTPNHPLQVRDNAENARLVQAQQGRVFGERVAMLLQNCLERLEAIADRDDQANDATDHRDHLKNGGK